MRTQLRSRLHVLFVPQGECLADATRSVQIASELRARDIEVTVAGRGSVLAQFTSGAGITLVDVPDYGAVLAHAMRRYGTGARYWHEARRVVETELSLFDEVRPAIVVGDCHPTLRIATATADLPYVSIIGASWTQAVVESRLPSGSVGTSTETSALRPKLDRRPINRRFRLRREPELYLGGWNYLAARFGVPPYSHPGDIFRGKLNLIPDCRELLPGLRFPSDHLFVGPLTWRGDGELPVRPRSRRKLVYATFGSTGSLAAMREVAEALVSLPVDAVMSVGPHVEPALFPEADNLTVAQIVPGLAIARQADLVICHGGLGSMYQATLAGTPVLGIPSSLEQQWNIDMFSRWGSAIGAAPSASSESIRDAVSGMLEESCFPRRALDLQRIALKYDAPGASANAIANVL